jgi:hypothetical protein
MRLFASFIESSNARWMLIVSVLVLAAATRILGSAALPVWTDEGWSVWAATEPPEPAAILDKITVDRHPPLYFMSLAVWEGIAGNSRIVLRFLAIAGGILTAAVIYRIGADVFSPATGLVAALLFAANGLAVYYGHEIRHYSWLILSVALMLLTFIRCTRHPTTANLILHALSIAFMLYTLYIGVLVWGMLGVVWLFLRVPFRTRVRIVGSWIAAVILYIPWIVVMLRQLSWISEGVVAPPSTIDTFVNTLHLLLGSAFVGIAYVLGLARIARTPNMARIAVLLCGIGLFVLMVVLNTRVGLMLPRIIVFLVPFLALVAAYGFTIHPIGIIAAVLLLPFSVPFEQPRMRYDVAAAELAAHYQPGDLVVLETGWDDNAFLYETRLALGENATIIRTLPWVDNRKPPVPVVPQIEEQLLAHDRVWVVNWLQPTQVIIYYLQMGVGAREQYQTYVGDAYAGLFPAPELRNVTISLFVRPE